MCNCSKNSNNTVGGLGKQNKSIVVIDVIVERMQHFCKIYTTTTPLRSVLATATAQLPPSKSSYSTMLVSTATRSLLRSNGALLRQNVRLMSSVAPSTEKKSVVTTAKREIHSDPPQMKSAPPLNYTAEATYSPEEAKEEETVSGMADRFKITAEVTVSKIFPAGFG